MLKILTESVVLKIFTGSVILKILTESVILKIALLTWSVIPVQDELPVIGYCKVINEKKELCLVGLCFYKS